MQRAAGLMRSGRRLLTHRQQAPLPRGAQATCREARALSFKSHATAHSQQQAVAQPVVTVGQELELTCERFGVARKGVCVLPPTGFIVLCERALPGERVLARVTEVKKGFATATKLQVLRPHDNGAEPACPHFGVCGGCSYQNLDYSAQLAAKQDQVAQQARRVGKVADVEAVLKPIVGCQEIYGYRNKTTFTFSSKVWEPAGAAACFQVPAESAQQHGKQPHRFALGLFKPGSNDTVLPVSVCSLQSEAANEALQLVRQVAQDTLPPLYNPRTRQGVMRQCIIRQGANPEHGCPELMVLLVVGRHEPSVLEPFVAALSQLPAVVSIYSVVAPRAGPPMEAVKATHLLSGQPRISERVCGLHFDISPRSFFQTNTRQAEVLYRQVEQAAGLREGCQDVVLDLYCGTGSIGLSLASRCKAVHGVEIVGPAVSDAKANARRNSIANATFEQADLSSEAAARDLFKRVQPDVVVVDPARSGLEGRSIIGLLAGSGARRIVYVSCNPSTQARDIDRLCHQEGSVYRLVSLQPVDMFPQTDHVECIAVMDHATAGCWEVVEVADTVKGMVRSYATATKAQHGPQRTVGYCGRPRASWEDW